MEWLDAYMAINIFKMFLCFLQGPVQADIFLLVVLGWAASFCIYLYSRFGPGYGMNGCILFSLVCDGVIATVYAVSPVPELYTSAFTVESAMFVTILLGLAVLVSSGVSPEGSVAQDASKQIQV